MITITKRALLVMGLATLAACAHPPGPQDAGLATPSAWSQRTTAEPSDNQPLVSGDAVGVEHRWWKSFRDPVLDRLIENALANNKSLAIAKARVEEARAGQSGAVANLLPSVSGTGSISRGNQGYATGNKAVNIREADVQASWELDLFGKNQARAGEAAAVSQAVEADAQAVMVSLLADVARNYFDLRNDQEQIRITRDNLTTQQKTLELIKAQMVGALSSDLDVERAAAQVSTTSAQLPALQSAYEVTLHRLNVLAGTAPGTEDAALADPPPFTALDGTILVAAPARVLANRPDIRAAERRFAASLSATEAATKELYPTLSLTALFGVQDSSAFSATPWGLGANLVQPILNFGRIRSQIDAADSRQTQAFLTYQETVLEALEDMENALSVYFHEAARHHDLDLAAQQNRRAVTLANQQYKSGYSGLLDLLVAQHDALEADSAVAASNVQLRKALVTIYAAAGGGWAL
ncbi:MAG TPA: efflux transporter outer membrane subunit [Telmatospirillum sp.]|nr:efflux transporter outer membrane subunit [Telmatospirillum sp.]